jgi:hypothetical protein
MFLRWSDVNFELRTVRVTSKPELGFYPKRWEDREIPAPVELIEELRKHTHRRNCQFVFPSPTGNRETAHARSLHRASGNLMKPCEACGLGIAGFVALDLLRFHTPKRAASSSCVNPAAMPA